MKDRGVSSKCIVIASLVGTISLFGCTDLPDLALDTCGNFVIDAKEDCDTYPEEGFACVAKGEPNECHYVCKSLDSECPPMYGCSTNGVCQRGIGEFIKKGEIEGFAWSRSIEVGDFDSDQQGDLLLLGALDSSGYRSVRALFSDGFSLQSGLSQLPLELANPAIGAGADTDVLHDIAFADLDGVALLRGYVDRTADFTVFPTISLPRGAHGKIVMTDALPSQAGDEIVSLITGFGGTHALVGIDLEKPSMKLTSLPSGENSLAFKRGYSTGHFDETLACAQIVLAYQGKNAVNLYSPCNSSGSWNVNGPQREVKLQPSAGIDQGVIPYDIDVDGDLDLMIGAGGRTYVAYGLGDGHFVSKKQNGLMDQAAPYDLPPAAEGPLGFPLAIADLNLDKKIDFVMPHGVVLSDGLDYGLAYMNSGSKWSEAVIANFNANDFPDIVSVVGGSLDLHFLNNAGSGVFGPAALPTEGIPDNLAVGDFDGDLLADLAFNEAILEHGEPSDHLSFAFGRPFGPLETPIATGEVGNLKQIATGHLQGQTSPDLMSEVVVVLEGNGGSSDNIATLFGRASRGIFSLIPLRTGSNPYIPISLAFGKFGDETPDIVALGADKSDGILRLFRIEAFEEEGIGIPIGSDPLLPNFIPWENSGSYNLRYGAKVVTADFDGDDTAEALVIGSYLDSEQTAMALAKYDTVAARFTMVDAKVFPAQFTTDSKVLVDDVDGDGAQDVLFTTGTSTAPRDLFILWGNGTAKLPEANRSLEPVRLDDRGVRAVAIVRARHGQGKMLVASNLDATYLLELTPEHSWSKVPIPGMLSAVAIAAVDFDRDGVQDLAVQLEDGLELFRSTPK